MYKYRSRLQVPAAAMGPSQRVALATTRYPSPRLRVCSFLKRPHEQIQALAVAGIRNLHSRVVTPDHLMDPYPMFFDT
jgi:hypothetical protein